MAIWIIKLFGLKLMSQVIQILLVDKRKVLLLMYQNSNRIHMVIIDFLVQILTHLIIFLNDFSTTFNDNTPSAWKAKG